MRNERRRRAAIAPAVLALGAVAAHIHPPPPRVSQVVEVQAGAYDATGGSVRMNAEGAEAWLGLAGVDPLLV